MRNSQFVTVGLISFTFPPFYAIMNPEMTSFAGLAEQVFCLEILPQQGGDMP